MTSWVLFCDVWYLEPQNIQPDETKTYDVLLNMANKTIFNMKVIEHFCVNSN
jgi:hypothetical protein